jgi:hypothetical protein
MWILTVSGCADGEGADDNGAKAGLAEAAGGGSDGNAGGSCCADAEIAHVVSTGTRHAATSETAIRNFTRAPPGQQEGTPLRPADTDGE